MLVRPAEKELVDGLTALYNLEFKGKYPTTFRRLEVGVEGRPPLGIFNLPIR